MRDRGDERRIITPGDPGPIQPGAYGGITCSNCGEIRFQVGPDQMPGWMLLECSRCSLLRRVGLGGEGTGTRIGELVAQRTALATLAALWHRYMILMRNDALYDDPEIRDERESVGNDLAQAAKVVAAQADRDKLDRWAKGLD